MIRIARITMPFEVAVISFVPMGLGYLFGRIACAAWAMAENLESDPRPGWAFGYFAAFGAIAAGMSLVVFGWVFLMQAQIIALLVARG